MEGETSTTKRGSEQDQKQPVLKLVSQSQISNVIFFLKQKYNEVRDQQHYLRILHNTFALWETL